MWRDDDLKSLTPAERADLAQRLAAVVDPLPHPTPHRERSRRLFVNLLVICCAVLIPWIGFLAVTLPPRYVAGHWQAAWVGFDIFLLIGLAVTAWAGWRRRQVVILSALVTGTLLVTDAWFDILTSSTTSGLLVSAADAVFVELPLATILFVVSGRLIRTTVQATRMLAGFPDASPPFWKVPLFVIDDPVATVAATGAGGPDSGTASTAGAASVIGGD
jgi:hypothetical protein